MDSKVMECDRDLIRELEFLQFNSNLSAVVLRTLTR